MGTDLSSTEIGEDYVIWSKLKNNSTICRVEENDLLPLQTITSDDNEEAFAGAATILSLLSSPTNNSASENLSQSSAKMKCYYHNKHYSLGYFNDPIQDDAVIYTSDNLPVQQKKR